MKKYSFCLLALLTAACSQEEIVEIANNTSGEIVQQIVMTAKDFRQEADTRTTLNPTAEGIEFTWAATDTVGIFPETGAQAYFPMDSGAGTKTATFNGGGWALKASSTYAAYYPIVGEFYLNRNAVPVRYTGQVQKGDASTAHLGAYDYMAAAPVTPSSGNVNFAFEHLGCLLQLKLTLANAGTISSVTLQPSEGNITVEGAVNLMATTPTIKTTTFATSLKLEVAEVTTSETNQTVTLYMMIPPIDLTNKTLKATVEMAFGAEYTIDLEGKSFIAGNGYSLSGIIDNASSTAEYFNFSDGVLNVDLDKTSYNLKQLCLENDIDLSSINKICLLGTLKSIDYDFLKVLASDYSLTYIDMSNVPITSLPSKVFQGCKLLETFIFPKGFTTLSYYEFYDCKNLKDIVLPDSMSQLGTGAFRGCRSLTTMAIPANVKSIGSQCFLYCYGLKEIHCKGTTPPRLDNGAFEGFSGITLYVPMGYKETYELTSVWCFFENIVEE